jgi:hypothetical protein
MVFSPYTQYVVNWNLRLPRITESDLYIGPISPPCEQTKLSPGGALVTGLTDAPLLVDSVCCLESYESSLVTRLECRVAAIRRTSPAQPVELRFFQSAVPARADANCAASGSKIEGVIVGMAATNVPGHHTFFLHPTCTVAVLPNSKLASNNLLRYSRLSYLVQPASACLPCMGLSFELASTAASGMLLFK